MLMLSISGEGCESSRAVDEGDGGGGRGGEERASKSDSDFFNGVIGESPLVMLMMVMVIRVMVMVMMVVVCKT